MDLNDMWTALKTPAADLTKMRRCLCGSMINQQENTRRWHSGIVNYDESLCGICRAEFADRSRIVCLGCRSLQGFVDPSVATTGFRFESRRHYHIEKCPRCDNSIVNTPVLEHEKFCRDRKIITRTNLDLVQEIEQKTLQGIRDADKLRAEMNSITP